MLRRSLVIIFMVMLAAAAGVFGGLYSQQESRAHRLSRALGALRVSDATLLARAESKERVTAAALRQMTAALGFEQRTVKALQFLETTTTTQPVALTDPQLLISDLDTASTQLTGSLPPDGQAQQFISEYHSNELANAQLAAKGRPYTSLDPMAEATAFIEANDQAAVEANNYAQAAGALQCMINTGSASCPSG